MSWAARQVVEHLSEEMKPFRDDLRRWPSPARGVSAGPITANPDHLSQQGHAKRADTAYSPAGFRVSSIAEMIHPMPGAADRDAGAVSGPIGPLPAKTVSRYVYRHAMRYVSGHVRSTTHRHAAHSGRRYVYRHAVRYVTGYVRGTTHRYATHTVRRDVGNMVRRYAGRYVCSNLSRQRVHHAR